MIITGIVSAVLTQFVTAGLQTGVFKGSLSNPTCGHAVSSANIENFFVRMYCETEERRSRLLMSDHHPYLLEFSADNWE